MKDLNKFVMVCRLTKDAEVKTFDNGGSVIRLSVANNYTTKRNGEWVDETSFFEIRHNCKSTGIVKFLTKGTQIAIEGCTRQERWEKDGKKNSRVYFQAETIQLLGSKNSSKKTDDVPQNVQALANAFDGEAFPEDIPF